MHAAITPFDQGQLDIGDGHVMHYEQVGRVDGVPAVFLHGGPGSAVNAQHRRLFDPERYRAVLFDQRGCGLSTPRGEIRHNTSAHLIADIERLRVHLGIERWLVVGGSWGACLAIAYAGAHPDRVSGLLLRGVFLGSHADFEWFFQGVAAFAPDAWTAFATHFPLRRRRHLLDACARIFARGDAIEIERLALAWSRYERALMGAATEPAISADELARTIDRYRVQIHYLARDCFLGERLLLGHVSRLQGVPMAIVHGRNDLVCRPLNAWRVHRTAHGSQLRLVVDAGHDAFHPAMAAAQVSALASFADDGHFVRWISP